MYTELSKANISLRFEIITVVSVKIAVFRHVTLCRFVRFDVSEEPAALESFINTVYL
jgi:hypothetical protein